MFSGLFGNEVGGLSPMSLLKLFLRDRASFRPDFSDEVVQSFHESHGMGSLLMTPIEMITIKATHRAVAVRDFTLCATTREAAAAQSAVIVIVSIFSPCRATCVMWRNYILLADT
jgi:hypothetical protein